MVCRRTAGAAFGQRTRALSDRNAMASGCFVHEREDLADVGIQLVVEALRTVDRGVALRPQPSMTGLEEMQRQLLLAPEVFVQRRIGVAAFSGDVTNARAVESSLAEQLHRRAEDLPLGRGIVLGNVERKRRSHRSAEVSKR